MTHPIVSSEVDYLLGDTFGALLQRVQIGSYGKWSGRHQIGRKDAP